MCESRNGFVIYDCDIGTDDAWGLLMLLKGEQLYKQPIEAIATASQKDSSAAVQPPGDYKVLAVTCVQGNTDVDNVAKNALRVLDSVDRCDIPVFKGCDQPILPRTWQRIRYFHGKDGFGDLQHEKDIDMKQLQKEHAVNAMYNFACKYPRQIDFILVGPLTNFAMCINMYGADFLDKVRNVFVMGGNYRGKGNITKSAEFNFMLDPEAAHIVLENAKTPLVIVPWETCIDGDFDITLDWRLNVLGAVPSKAIELMNKVERAIFVPLGFEKWITCDAILTAVYILPHLAIEKSRVYHATVELTGTHTRGQMVLDHLHEKPNNAIIITAVSKSSFKNIIAWTAGAEALRLQGDALVLQCGK